MPKKKKRIERQLFDAIDADELDKFESLTSETYDPNFYDADRDNTLLASAVIFERPEMVQSLLAAGANVHPDRGDDPLSAAVRMRNIQILKRLLDNGANPAKLDAKATEQRRYWTYLMQAAEKCDIDAVRMLVEYGANVDVKNFEGDTAGLFTAKQLDLFERTGDQRRVNEARAVLEYLMPLGSDETRQQVVAFQSDPVRRLARAAEAGRLEEVTELLTKGVDANSIDEEGQSVLAIAVSSGHLDIVRVLLEGGATPDLVQSEQDHTPLHFAAVSNQLEIVKVLVNAGADVNRIDIRAGCTLFMHVVQNNCVDIARFLIEVGADIHATDRQGNTASAYMNLSPMHYDYTEIKKLLAEYGIATGKEKRR